MIINTIKIQMMVVILTQVVQILPVQIQLIWDFSTRYGGQIGQGMQAGGPAGFIGGPPENYSDQTTIADDIPLEVPEGAFIINAPAVEYAGSEDISKMLTEAYEKAGQGG